MGQTPATSNHQPQLTPCITNQPKLSVRVKISGTFDYNRAPLDPPGICVSAHVRPEEQKSWDIHTTNEFYIRLAMYHYIFHNIWSPTILDTHIAQALKWMPHNFSMPASTRQQIILCSTLHFTTTHQKRHGNNNRATINHDMHLDQTTSRPISAPIIPTSRNKGAH